MPRRGSKTATSGRSDRGGAAIRPYILRLFLIAAVGLTLRLVYLAGAAENPLYLHPALDGRVNDQQAWLIVSGTGGATEAAQPYFRPPGYAHFLAAVYAVAGHDLRAPRVAQTLLGALSIVLLGLLTGALWGSRVGTIAAVLGAVFGPAIYFEGELLSAALEVFLALLSLWLLVECERRRSPAWCAAAGLALALAAVTRPTILPFAVLAGVWLWGRGVSRRALAVFAASALSLPAACTIRNAVVARDPVFIASQGGINFYIGNHAGADGTTPNVPGLGSGVNATYDAPFREASRQAARELRASEVSAFWFAKGFSFWRTDPGAALKLFVKKVAMVWNRRELPNTQDQAFFASRNSWLFRGPWLLSFAFLAPIALVAAWFERRRAAVLLLYAVAITSTTAAFFVCDRFRLPLVAFVAPLAAVGLVRTWDFARRWGADRSAMRPAALALAGGLLVVGIAFVCLPFQRWQKTEEGMSWYRLARAYEEAERLQDARTAYMRAHAAGFSTREFLYDYGMFAYRQGATAQAVALLSDAGDYLPSTVALAEIWERAGHWRSAAAAYQSAAKGLPEQAAELLTNAGVLFQRGGMVNAARAAYIRALARKPNLQPAIDGLRSLGPPPDGAPIDTTTHWTDRGPAK